MTFKNKIRTILVLTGKDLLSGIKNKTVISAIVSALFVVIAYSFLPELTKEDVPTVIVYDAGSSTITPELESSPNLLVSLRDSENSLVERMNHGDTAEIGLILPSNLDQQIADGNSIVLQGYTMNWADEKDLEDLRFLVEDELAYLSGVPVSIEVSTLHSKPDASGLIFLTGMGLFFLLMITGVQVPALLLLEEKQSRTLSVLRVSPAGETQIILSKMLTAAVYGIIAMVIAFLVNSNLITQWWVAISTSLVGVFFPISIGLLLGTILESRQQYMIWAWGVFILLFIPTFLIVEGFLPAWLTQLLTWSPTAALIDLFRISMSNQLSLITFAGKMAGLILPTILIMAIVLWLANRPKRRTA
jgi:hypothetical protein